MDSPNIFVEKRLQFCRENALYLFLVFTHVMRRPCWCTKQWQNVAQVLHNNRIKFPQDFLPEITVWKHYCLGIGQFRILTVGLDLA